MGPVRTSHGHCSPQRGWQGHLLVATLARLLPAVLLLGKGMCQGYRQPRGCHLLPCTCPEERLHPQKGQELPDTPQPCREEEKGSGGTGWQQEARCPGRVVHHGRRMQPVPPSTTRTADGSAALGARTRPCTTPGDAGPLCSAAALPAEDQDSRSLAPEPAPASELPSNGQQQSTPAVMPLLCCHGSARKQPSVLRQSRMFLAQAAQQLAEVPAVSQPRLSCLPLGDCGVPKATLTCQSSTEEGSYWLRLDLRVLQDDSRASRADGNTSLLPLPHISKVSASCSLL